MTTLESICRDYVEGKRSADEVFAAAEATPVVDPADPDAALVHIVLARNNDQSDPAELRQTLSYHLGY